MSTLAVQPIPTSYLLPIPCPLAQVQPECLRMQLPSVPYAPSVSSVSSVSSRALLPSFAAAAAATAAVTAGVSTACALAPAASCPAPTAVRSNPGRNKVKH